MLKLKNTRCFFQDTRTPLHRAASREVVNALIDRGADINAKDGEERTPLHRAAAGGYTEVVNALIEKGADINAKDGEGWTPLNWAAEKGNTDAINALLEAKANVEEYRELQLKGSCSEKVESRRKLKFKQEVQVKDISLIGKEGRCKEEKTIAQLEKTIAQLEKAFKAGKLEDAKELVRKVENLNVLCLSGGQSLPLLLYYFVMHACVSEKWFEFYRSVLSGEDGKVDINAVVTLLGDTALKYACKKGNRNVAELLLEHGADVNKVGAPLCEAPILIALEKNDHNLAELLFQYGAKIDVNAIIKREIIDGICQYEKKTMRVLSQRTFNLEWNENHDGSVKALSEALKSGKFPNLASLSLSLCYADGDKNVKALNKALKKGKLPNLTSLHLKWDETSYKDWELDKSYMALSEALSKRGEYTLSKALSKSGELISLSLEWNKKGITMSCEGTLKRKSSSEPEVSTASSNKLSRLLKKFKSNKANNQGAKQQEAQASNTQFDQPCPNSELSEVQPMSRSQSLNSLHSDDGDIKIDSSSQCR